MLARECACTSVHMCSGPGCVHVCVCMEGLQGRKKRGKRERGMAGGLGHSD